jgi:hypothetical protein
MRIDLNQHSLRRVNIDLQSPRFIQRRVEEGEETLQE